MGQTATIESALPSDTTGILISRFKDFENRAANSLGRAVHDFRNVVNECLDHLPDTERVADPDAEGRWESLEIRLRDDGHAIRRAFRRQLLLLIDVPEPSARPSEDAVETLLGRGEVCMPAVPSSLRVERLSLMAALGALVGILLPMPLLGFAPERLASAVHALVFLSGIIGAMVAVRFVAMPISPRVRSLLLASGGAVVLGGAALGGTLLPSAGWWGVFTSLRGKGRSGSRGWLLPVAALVALWVIAQLWARRPELEPQRLRGAAEECVARFEESLRADLRALAFYQAHPSFPFRGVSPEGVERWKLEAKTSTGQLDSVRERVDLALRDRERAEPWQTLDALASELGLLRPIVVEPFTWTGSSEQEERYTRIGVVRKGDRVEVRSPPIEQDLPDGAVRVVRKGEVVAMRG